MLLAICSLSLESAGAARNPVSPVNFVRLWSLKSLTLNVDIDLTSNDTAITQIGAFSAHYAVDRVGKNLEVIEDSTDAHRLIPAFPGHRLEVRQIGTIVWGSVTDGLPASDAKFGSRWIRFDHLSANQLASNGLSRMIGIVLYQQRLSRFRRMGLDRSIGCDCVRYQADYATIGLRFADAVAEGSGGSVPANVWIDRLGRVRTIQFTVALRGMTVNRSVLETPGVSARVRLTFFGFNESIQVAEPPAADVQLGDVPDLTPPVLD